MTLSKAENMLGWIGEMSVEDFAGWLEEYRKQSYDAGYYDGRAEGYNLWSDYGI